MSSQNMRGMLHWPVALLVTHVGVAPQGSSCSRGTSPVGGLRGPASITLCCDCAAVQGPGLGGGGAGVGGAASHPAIAAQCSAAWREPRQGSCAGLGVRLIDIGRPHLLRASLPQLNSWVLGSLSTVPAPRHSISSYRSRLGFLLHKELELASFSLPYMAASGLVSVAVGHLCRSWPLSRRILLQRKELRPELSLFSLGVRTESASLSLRSAVFVFTISILLCDAFSIYVAAIKLGEGHV